MCQVRRDTMALMSRKVPDADAERRRKLNSGRWRTITRGPRKGLLIRKTRAERNAEMTAAAVVQKAAFVERVTRYNIAKAETKTPQKFVLPDLTIAWVLLSLSGLSVLSYWATRKLAEVLTYIHLAPLFLPLIFADYIAWRLIVTPRHRNRYLPIVWWIFGRS